MQKINKDIKEKIINYLEPYHPAKIGIFGSYARGEQTTESDLDILVNVKNISLLEFVGIEQALSEKIGIKVELLSERALTNKLLRKYIMQDLQVIYEQG